MKHPHRILLFGLLAASAFVPALAAAPALASSGSHALPKLITCAGKQQTRPPGEFVFACGDGNIAIAGTHWSSWTSNSATGTTDLQINLCEPTCVASKMSSFAGSTVRLYDVEVIHRTPVFTRAQITYGHGGKSTTVTAYPRT